MNHDETVTISEFAHAHPEYLIIVANPKSDRLFMAYKGKHVYNQIKNAEGKELHVVRDMLKRSTFAGSIDHFIVSLVDIFQVSLKHANDFYQWVDGAVCALSSKGRNTETKHAKKAKRRSKRG